MLKPSALQLSSVADAHLSISRVGLPAQRSQVPVPVAVGWLHRLRQHRDLRLRCRRPAGRWWRERWRSEFDQRRRGSSAQPQCPDYVPYSVAIPWCGDGGPPPAGAVQPGAWYVDLCARGQSKGIATGVQWFATGQAPGTPPPDPATVGAQAASELQLSSPSLALSPSSTGYVNLAEWLSVAPSIWHPFTTSAQACNAGGCTTATATATPAIRDVEHRRRFRRHV